MTDLSRLAAKALDAARQADTSIVTAESCTGGKLASLLSETPGAGELLHGGFVTYTKANKTKALGVNAALLASKGAVCSEVAVAMAEGALARSPAGIAVAITGVAGPDPDKDGNPVGLVFIAIAHQGGDAVHLEKRYGAVGSDQVCKQAMADALLLLIGRLRTG